MKKLFTQSLKKICLGIMSAILTACMVMPPINTYASEGGTPIRQTTEDTHVIPDKYNTMAVAPSGGFTTIKNENTLSVTNSEGQPVTIKFYTSENVQKIDLEYSNKDLEGTILFENIDFSSAMDTLVIQGDSARQNTKKKVHFIFKNCVFSKFNCSREGNEYVEYTFENCTFQSFWGSNAIIKNCYFGGGIGDRIIPFCRVTVEDCYIANPTSRVASEEAIHTDGTQLYGWETTEVYDVRFSRCRFEMPAIQYPNAPKTYVNACIMLQLEYNNGHDISFTDCYVNGGGYSVYASFTNNRQYKNTYFKNLKFGCSARYGKIYRRILADGVTLNEDTWTDASSIYVGTVNRNSNNKIILSVSNDTNQKRTFKVYTSSGKSYNFTIGACPRFEDFGSKTFEQFPFDKLYTIPEAADWIVCYDTTAGKFKQVRYINWGDSDLVLTKDNAGNNIVKELNNSIPPEFPAVPESPAAPITPVVPETPVTPEVPGQPENSDKGIPTVKSVTLSKTSYIYSGKDIKPKVVIKDENGTVLSASDYLITYENNKKVGIGTVKITMNGDYKGTYTRKFTIRPAGTNIRKAAKKGNKITVAWKQIKQTTGYQIQISTDKKFKDKNTKTYSIKNNKTISRTFKIPQTKKPYYVRVRTYKIVKIDGVNKKVYSTWSTKKTIK